jgi:hypothetical protein
MNSNERTHPIEIALVLALVTVGAVTTLVSVLIALVATALNQGPSEQSPVPLLPPAQTPMVHPLQVLATEIQCLACRDLMALAGTRKRLNKQQLVGMVVAVGV